MAPFTICPGSIADYDRLAIWHYRSGRPATCVRVLIARAQRDPAILAAARRTGRAAMFEPVGVLVVSMPVLSGPWRTIAWPGLYAPAARTPAARRDAAARINRDIRVISRVVVDPRWRGAGVATALVRAYLADPLTPRTEALAAMGAACPLFERAGMRPIPFPPARRTRRLLATLDRLWIDPLALADPAGLLGSLGPATRRRLIAALRSFALENRDTRRAASSTDLELVTLAARRVLCRPVAYVADAGPSTDPPPHG